MVYESSLYHHGILNQKWGQRNGPPYPLSSSQKSAAEKKANKGRSAKDMSDDELRTSIKRMEREKRYNELSKTKDPKTEKLEKTKQIVDASQRTVEQASRMNRESMKNQTKKEKLDLSKMSDQELRDKINRANLERQYNDLFGKEKSTVSKGQVYAQQFLDTSRDVLAVTGSALTIIMAVKTIKGV